VVVTTFKSDGDLPSHTKLRVWPVGELARHVIATLTPLLSPVTLYWQQTWP